MPEKRIIIFTGEGKGKTTAAIGNVVRALGHGKKASIVQFIKASKSGEFVTLGKLDGVEFLQTGLGWVPEQEAKDFARHVAAAQHGVHIASKKLSSPSWDVVVLDEVLTAIKLNLIEEEAILEAMENAASNTIIILTGRGASPKVISLADTATEMHCIKHAYESGRRAQKGVEF